MPSTTEDPRVSESITCIAEAIQDTEWGVRFHDHSHDGVVRWILHGVDEKDNNIMVVYDNSKSRKSRNKYYVLRAKKRRWIKCSREILLCMIRDHHLPDTAGTIEAYVSCACAKLKFPSSRQSMNGALRVRKKYGEGLLRTYRCLDDPRVFHLTSRGSKTNQAVENRSDDVSV